MCTLGPEDQRLLLALARRAIRYHLACGKEPDAAALDLVPAGTILEPGAAFVTLKNGDRLRGCIGRLDASAPLWQTVASTAIGAAVHDFRFASVEDEELDEISITISVLTTPKPVPSWEGIEIGRHGIVMSKGGRASTFLPEVPVEHGWNLEETLGRLATKAGLPEDAWRREATFEVFEAQVFHDRDNA